MRDGVSGFLSESTGIVEKIRGLNIEKDHATTTLNCFNVNAAENGCLSFLDGVLPGGLSGPNSHL